MVYCEQRRVALLSIKRLLVKGVQYIGYSFQPTTHFLSITPISNQPQKKEKKRLFIYFLRFNRVEVN